MEPSIENTSMKKNKTLSIVDYPAVTTYTFSDFIDKEYQNEKEIVKYEMIRIIEGLLELQNLRNSRMD